VNEPRHIEASVKVYLNFDAEDNEWYVDPVTVDGHELDWSADPSVYDGDAAGPATEEEERLLDQARGVPSPDADELVHMLREAIKARNADAAQRRGI
jgi:hypothetical protein